MLSELRRGLGTLKEIHSKVTHLLGVNRKVAPTLPVAVDAVIVVLRARIAFATGLAACVHHEADILFAFTSI